MVTATHPTNHRHTEADVLMYYVSTTTIRGYWVLNTRAGVTPFAFTENGERFQHFEWALDRHEPGMKPTPGLRYFRERTPEEAQASAEYRLELLCQSEKSLKPGSVVWQVALAELVQAYLASPCLDRMPVVEALAPLRQAA